MNKKAVSLLAFAAFAGFSAIASAADSEPKLVWETEAQLAAPENVILDSKRQQLYVSSINGNPDEVNGLGYLSVVSLDGKITQKEWIKGLNAPKGMEIYQDILYVTDINTLVAIDLEQQRIIARYPAVGAVFLNDAIADGAGNIYVSDMMTESVYRLQNGRLDLWLKDPALQAPNGMLMHDGKLLVGGWGVLTEGFGTSTLGHLNTVDLNTREIKSLGNGQPVANIDGLRADGKGNYLITDWMVGKLLRVSTDGSAKTLLTLTQGSADIEYLQDKKLVLIPMMMHNTLRAYQLAD